MVTDLASHPVEVIFHRGLRSFTLEEQMVLLELLGGKEPVGRGGQEPARHGDQVVVLDRVLVVVGGSGLKRALEESLDFLLLGRMVHKVLGGILEVQAALRANVVSKWLIANHRSSKVREAGGSLSERVTGPQGVRTTRFNRIVHGII